MSRNSECLLNEFEKARGLNKHYDGMLNRVKNEISNPMEVGPKLADHLVVLQGGLLLVFGESHVAETFCNLRLDASSLSSGWISVHGKRLISTEAQDTIISGCDYNIIPVFSITYE